MTTSSKLSPYLCIVYVTLALGCSRNTGQDTSAPVTPTPTEPTVASPGIEPLASADTENQTQNTAGNQNEPVNREQLARRIEAGRFIDTASIDAELARIRRDMIIDRYLEKLYKTNVSTADIEAYYRDHNKEFKTREIELAHILIRVPPNASAEVKDTLNTKARDIAARLHAGETFETLAKAFSEDEVSASLGGNLGWVGEHELAESVMTPTLLMQPGTVSAPLGTTYGIHIVKALSAVREVQKPLSEVRARITQILRASAKEAALIQLAATNQ